MICNFFPFCATLFYRIAAVSLEDKRTRLAMPHLRDTVNRRANRLTRLPMETHLCVI